MEYYEHCREARRKCWEYTGKVGITLPRSDSEATGFVFHDKVMKKHRKKYVYIYILERLIWFQLKSSIHMVKLEVENQIGFYCKI